MSTLVLRERRERVLRALGILLMMISACAVAAAFLIGSWNVYSIDGALAAHLPQRAALALFGLVLGSLGWVLSGSGTQS